MTSPKTIFSGYLQLGLVSIPITVGKAWSDPENVSDVVKDVNVIDGNVHGIDRRWRDAETLDLVSDVRKAIQISENNYRLIPDDEWSKIEEATKTNSLIVLDVQPSKKLPLLYSLGCWYVRHDAKSKVQPVALANLIAAMTKDRIGMVCQWGSSHRQKLCVLSAESGVMIMRVIPHLTEVRVASKMERSHMAVKPDPELIDKFSELLGEFRTEKFNYSAYADEGLKRRRAIIKKVLKGEKFKEPEQENPIDVFEALEIALAERAAKRDKIATTTNN